MADGTVARSSRRHRTICLSISEESYRGVVGEPAAFRRWLDEAFRAAPELFPPGFSRGYELKDGRTSAKRELPIRRIRLRDGAAYSVRPSFLMPYMAARVEDVEGPLFLRTFGVPFWALARVFGRDPMYWYRLTGYPVTFRRRKIRTQQDFCNTERRRSMPRCVRRIPPTSPTSSGP